MATSEFRVMLCRARKTEAEALAKLYHLFYPGVAIYILNHVPLNMAEDLTSEVFVKMIENLHKVRAEDETSFSAWLNAIAKNVVAGHYRTQEKAELRYTSISGERVSLAPYADPERYVEDREMHEALTEEMNSLTEEQRLILRGRFEHGHDTQTLAQQIGRDAATVRMLQHRALKRLRRAMAVRILAILLLLGSILGTAYTFVRTASPGSPLYPVKQWMQQSLPGPQPHHNPPHSAPSPSSTPTPAVRTTRTPTATPASTPASVQPTLVPSATATPKPLLHVNAGLSILPVSTSTATPAHLVCLAKICI